MLPHDHDEDMEEDEEEEEVSLISISNPFASWTGLGSDHMYAASQQPYLFTLAQQRKYRIIHR